MVALTAREIIWKHITVRVQKVNMKFPYVQFAEIIYIYICIFFSACPIKPHIDVDDNSYNGVFNAPKVFDDWNKFWMSRWGRGSFTLDLGCRRQITGVRLRNSFGKDGNA